MPAISSTTLMNATVNLAVAVTNATDVSNAVQVVCAWPVSGQYGPGSRILYYVLVTACVFARKAEWLRNPCLAAALLFPAVAALHGIVLAAVHVDGAVDMDVFGAFQLCSIGILAAPVTVRLSGTYFNDPGRNIIFLWTILILAGLLSLTVEFYRITPSSCTQDDFNNPFPSGPFQFPYENATCGLTCSVHDGPPSPIRGGSANNIYVIPSPEKFTFNTATLLAAACCIPAVLSLVSMWTKILEINWRKTRFADGDADGLVGEETISGTNGATIENMKVVNSLIRRMLRFVESPVFFAAVLAILVIGERNFWSTQVRYQTEPIASIGQWAPIVGTGLAVIGSLYVLATAEVVEEREDHTPKMGGGNQDRNPTPSVHHCSCSMHEVNIDLSTAQTHPASPPGTADGLRNSSASGRGTMVEVIPTTSRPSLAQVQRSADASRQKVARGMAVVVNYFGVAAPDRFDDSEFKRGPALDFPEIPGEQNRNKSLHQIKKQYNQVRDPDETSTHALRRQHSRANSFTSDTSTYGADELPRAPRSPSPAPRSSSALPSPTRQRPVISTDRGSFDLGTPPLSTGDMPRPRRDTLEVPSPVHHRSNSSFLPESQNPPAIVISHESPSFASTRTSSPTLPESTNSKPPVTPTFP